MGGRENWPDEYYLNLSMLGRGLLRTLCATGTVGVTIDAPFMYFGLEDFPLFAAVIGSIGLVLSVCFPIEKGKRVARD